MSFFRLHEGEKVHEMAEGVIRGHKDANDRKPVYREQIADISYAYGLFMGLAVGMHHLSAEFGFTDFDDLLDYMLDISNESPRITSTYIEPLMEELIRKFVDECTKADWIIKQN